MVIETDHKINHINKKKIYNYANSFTGKMTQSVIIIWGHFLPTEH